MAVDFDVAASRATKPLFYRAPHPEGVTPYEFQHAGVEYHLARDHALFGDAPGLGKTAECILLGNAIRALHTLVICPASLRLNWEREIWAWSTIPGLSTYPILKGSDGVSHLAHYVITSYSMLQNRGIFDALMVLSWDHLILDEAHALKDPGGNRRTRAICATDGLRSIAGRITMASGTILPNQPIECYNAARLLCWDSIDRASLEDFREEYYDLGSGFMMRRGKVEWSDRVRNVPRRLDDLQRRLRRYLMVRRLKEDVMPQLPRRQWHLFPLETTAGIREALHHPGWQRAERMYQMDPKAFRGGIEIDGEISTARRLLGEAKAPAVAAYVRELVEAGARKVVVGAWHRSVLAYLREKLQDLGLEYMDGSSSQASKQRAVDRFQGPTAQILPPLPHRNEVRVILGQSAVIGEGWNLHAAEDVVLAEPDWVPGRNDQLLDRVHRIGQRGSRVVGHVPVVPDTLDERVLAVAVRKDRAIYEALDKRDEAGVGSAR